MVKSRVYKSGVYGNSRVYHIVEEVVYDSAEDETFHHVHCSAGDNKTKPVLHDMDSLSWDFRLCKKCEQLYKKRNPTLIGSVGKVEKPVDRKKLFAMIQERKEASCW